MEHPDTLKKVENQLAESCAKIRSIRSWYEEFFDYINNKNPDMVKEIMDEMEKDR